MLLLCLWLLLLPLRGWAGPAMHLPVPDAAVAAPCHGAEKPAPQADAAKPCTLCDVCHGALAPTDSVAQRSTHDAQSLPPALQPAAPAIEPDALFRPPRR